MPEGKRKNSLRMRHWVLLIALTVAFAQFYFITLVLDFYSAPRLVVFASATASTLSPGTR